MNEKELWIWLSKLEIKNKNKIKIKIELINKFENHQNLWKANFDDLIYFKFSDKVIDKVMDLNTRKELDKELEFLIKNNIKLVNFKENLYPKKLLNIYDYPLVLYYIGDFNLLNDFNVAIVGARMASQYGKNISRNISR